MSSHNINIKSESVGKLSSATGVACDIARCNENIHFCILVKFLLVLFLAGVLQLSDNR